MESSLDPLFGAVIHAYSRTEAIADGTLVDVSETAREAGILYPVALTRAAYERVVAWDETSEKRTGASQDEAGRLWDVLTMLRAAARNQGGRELTFRVLAVDRDGTTWKPRLHELKSVCGPGDTPAPVITVMLPDEN